MSAARGGALVASLERRFVTTRERVVLPGGFAAEIVKPRSAEDLISEEDFERDERLPYWAEVWPSSLVLAGRLLRERGEGRRLLELGCGLGIVVCAAMRAGFDVVASDYYDDALRFTRANAWLALGREPAVRHVDWRRFPSDLGRFDVVAASDVLYERPYATLVADAVAATLAPGGMALIADPGRVAAPAFLTACRSLGLRVGAPEEHAFTSGKVRQRIRVYTVRGG